MASLEYLAGYFDGEGCVCVSAGSHGAKSLYLLITIQTGDPEIVQLFAEQFGGTCKAIANKPNASRQQYRWAIYGVKAQNALRQLLPFLIGKREVAELALIPVFGFRGKSCVPKEEVERRNNVASKISTINQRVTIATA